MEKLESVKLAALAAAIMSFAPVAGCVEEELHEEGEPIGDIGKGDGDGDERASLPDLVDLVERVL